MNILRPEDEATVMVNVPELTVEPSSRTRIEIVEVPTSTGVPVIAPVDSLILKPTGKVPEAMEKTFVPEALVTVGVKEKLVPVVAL